MSKCVLVSVFSLIGILLSGRDTALFKIITSPLPVRHMTSIAGKIIITRYDGIFEFDGEFFKKSKYKYADISAKLANNEQWARLVDADADYAQVQLSNDGVYWVLIKNKFLYGYRIIDKIKRILPDYSIRGVYSNDGDSLLVATYNGFFMGTKQIYKDTLLFSNSNFWVDEKFIYFSANYEDHVYRLNKQFSALELVIPGSIKSKFLRSISSIVFFDDHFYIGGQNGFGKYKADVGFELIDGTVDVQNVHITDGRLWLACKNGIYILKENKIEKKFNLSSTGLFYSKDKIISTSFSGLWEYDLVSKKVVNLLKGTAYEDTETDGLFIDKFGNFWISSTDGILRFNLKDNKISTLLQGTEFNRRSYFFKGDTLYFGTNSNGLISFNVESMISEESMSVLENRNNRLAYFVGVSVLLVLFVVLFQQFKGKNNSLFQRNVSKIAAPKNDIFFDLKDYIAENIDHLNVDQIRYRTGLTKYAFYTRFYQYFGKKPKELISEIKHQLLIDKQRVKVNNRVNSDKSLE